jgi:hypothetical protein
MAVGQPILAAAGFKPALVHSRKSRLKRRLRAGLPAPLAHEFVALEGSRDFGFPGESHHFADAM